ncbi:hypothetical protein B0H14DRAFT_2780632 [Mycena olivaceomarginata]|nr:hypothetical protein B0H14DRAFT_2780632 [Mycena olivaceomarginata]
MVMRAAVLQREGHEVVFPRYHVGESLLPWMRNYLQFHGEKGMAPVIAATWWR